MNVHASKDIQATYVIMQYVMEWLVMIRLCAMERVHVLVLELVYVILDIVVSIVQQLCQCVNTTAIALMELVTLDGVHVTMDTKEQIARNGLAMERPKILQQFVVDLEHV
jgi:hypothetical protein